MSVASGDCNFAIFDQKILQTEKNMFLDRKLELEYILENSCCLVKYLFGSPALINPRGKLLDLFFKLCIKDIFIRKPITFLERK